MGGLRSPCMNAHYFVDPIDRVGHVLRSFDGMFELEREKEFFYMECNMRLLTSGRQIHVSKECRLVRLMANMRRLLDEFGRANALPRSSVCVNEDFWYMRGGKDRIDTPVQDKAWPCMSIFHNHSPSALQLNPMLSQTICGVDVQDYFGVEGLKQVLFRNLRESMSEFFKLRQSGKAICKVNIGKYSCCECRCAQCNITL